MGRWRPPRQAGSPYITPAGYRALQDELEALWPQRRDVVAALSAAAAEGDRSENAEYIYRKKELGGIDRRIRYLQKRLPSLEIVRHSLAPDRVFFGATVTLDVGKDEPVIYRVVGEDEADPSNGKINIDSPLAQALMKKRIGDEALITRDKKQTKAVIESIDYETDADK
ncbi:MAG: GreA/GreB family elongation factor [Woeseiaceae bacterium]